MKFPITTALDLEPPECRYSYKQKRPRSSRAVPFGDPTATSLEPITPKITWMDEVYRGMFVGGMTDRARFNMPLILFDDKAYHLQTFPELQAISGHLSEMQQCLDFVFLLLR